MPACLAPAKPYSAAGTVHRRVPSGSVYYTVLCVLLTSEAPALKFERIEVLGLRDAVLLGHSDPPHGLGNVHTGLPALRLVLDGRPGGHDTLHHAPVLGHEGLVNGLPRKLSGRRGSARGATG